jgi:hypothetical protein
MAPRALPPSATAAGGYEVVVVALHRDAHGAHAEQSAPPLITHSNALSLSGLWLLKCLRPASVMWAHRTVTTLNPAARSPALTPSLLPQLQQYLLSMCPAFSKSPNGRSELGAVKTGLQGTAPLIFARADMERSPSEISGA